MDDRKEQMHEGLKRASLVCAVLALIVGTALLLFAKYAKEKGYSHYFWDSHYQEGVDRCNTLAWIFFALMVIEVILYFYHSNKLRELSDQYERYGKNLWTCPDCGNMLSKSASMCPKCGRKITDGEAEQQPPRIRKMGKEWKCPRCGRSNSYLKEYCTKCGTPQDKADK